MNTLVDQDASTNFVIWSNKLCHATTMLDEDFVQCLIEASCSQPRTRWIIKDIMGLYKEVQISF